MREIIKKYTKDQSAQITIISSLVAPVLFAAIAIASDYFCFYRNLSMLQDAADSAALAGAMELSLAGSDKSQIEEIAKSYSYSNFYKLLKEDEDPGHLTVKTSLISKKKEVKVDLEYVWQPFFAHNLSGTILPIKVSSTAGLVGSSSVCTLTLDEIQRGSIELMGDASIIAKECAIQSNSKNHAAIIVPPRSSIYSSSVCSSGGYSGINFDIRPGIDCPQVPDPLTERTVPVASKCKKRNLKISGGQRKLKPGTYCGGIFITDSAKVTLQSGKYVFVDGDLDVGGGSKLTGINVHLYFADNARLFIRNSSVLNLTAPQSGPMTGILIAANPSLDKDLLFEIQSQDAENFTGLIYTPNNTFKIGDDVDGDGKCDPGNDLPRIPRNFDTDDDDDDDDDGSKNSGNRRSGDNTIGCETNIGQYSDWTAIISRNIKVTSGVELVLNADYSASSIPVPENSGLVGGQVSLLK